VVGSSISNINTRRRQQHIFMTVTYIVSRGPRRKVDEDSRQVILVASQLVRVRHCVCSSVQQCLKRDTAILKH